MCNLTVARMQNILGLHTRTWYDFKDLDGKIANGGVFAPSMLVLLCNLYKLLEVRPNIHYIL